MSWCPIIQISKPPLHDWYMTDTWLIHDWYMTDTWLICDWYIADADAENPKTQEIHTHSKSTLKIQKIFCLKMVAELMARWCRLITHLTVSKLLKLSTDYLSSLLVIIHWFFHFLLVIISLFIRILYWYWYYIDYTLWMAIFLFFVSGSPVSIFRD